MHRALFCTGGGFHSHDKQLGERPAQGPRDGGFAGASGLSAPRDGGFAGASGLSAPCGCLASLVPAASLRRVDGLASLVLAVSLRRVEGLASLVPAASLRLVMEASLVPTASSLRRVEGLASPSVERLTGCRLLEGISKRRTKLCRETKC